MNPGEHVFYMLSMLPYRLQTGFVWFFWGEHRSYIYTSLCVCVILKYGSKWFKHIKASISAPQGYFAQIYDFPLTVLESPTKEVQKTRLFGNDPPQCLVWTLCREMVGYHWKTMGNHSRVCVGGGPNISVKACCMDTLGPPRCQIQILSWWQVVLVPLQWVIAFCWPLLLDQWTKKYYGMNLGEHWIYMFNMLSFRLKRGSYDLYHMSPGHTYTHNCLCVLFWWWVKMLQTHEAGISAPQRWFARIYDFPSTDFESPTREVQKKVPPGRWHHLRVWYGPNAGKRLDTIGKPLHA